MGEETIKNKLKWTQLILKELDVWMTRDLGESMNFVKYLGRRAPVLLGSEPFNKWTVERTLDEDSDPPLIGYSFKECGLQFNCDRDSERIRSIFLERDRYAGAILSEIPFDLRRNEVLNELGKPTKSGEETYHPILGKFGAWDRFQFTGYTIHVQYSSDENGIDKITYMRNDVVPNAPS
jgi:hypothetical protein